MRYLGTLKYLDLANNYIQEVPSAISQMLNLRELKLNNNQLYDIPNEIFDLGLLRKLHLHYNSLHQLSDDIGDLAHLEELKLHYNLLHELPVFIDIIVFVNFEYITYDINAPDILNITGTHFINGDKNSASNIFTCSGNTNIDDPK